MALRALIAITMLGAIPVANADNDPPPSGPEAVVVDEKTAPGEAARLTREAEKLDPAARHRWAVAANTRGLRLFQGSKEDDALPLFEAAAALDRSYGMPRYNAARCYALKNDAASALRYLRELKALGKPQLDRLSQAQKDEGFAKIVAAPGWKELFSSLPAPPPAGLWRALLAKKSWSLRWVKKAESHPDGAPPPISLTLRARKVGAADVATLGWEVSGSTASLPKVIAVTDAGAWIFDEGASDAKIAAGLKKKPGFADPPLLQRANTRKDGLFAFTPPGRGDAVCFGFDAPKPEEDDAGCGAYPCCAWLCIDAGGLFSVGGIGETNDSYGVEMPMPCG